MVKDEVESEVFNGATFSCGYKLVPTQKGWRTEIHCYANSPIEVVDLVTKTLELAEGVLTKQNRPIAPMEIPK